jgi:hypothetical protein
MNAQCTDTASFVIDLASGISMAASDELRMRPNPFHNHINIIPAEENKEVMLNIYSAEGKLLFSQAGTSPVIWGEAQQPGIYFVKVKFPGKTERYYQIVKIY